MNTKDLIYIGSWKAAEPKDIILLHADINYTNVHFADGRKLTIATTMKKLEKRFELYQMFFRTHKSFMVNLQYIKRIDSFNTEDFVEMKNDYRVAIARRRKVAFEDRIKELNT